MTVEKSGGFTLFEILLAMAILGIVSVSGFSAYTISLQKSRDGAKKKSLQALQQALEAYQNDYGAYPAADGSGLIVACGDGSSSCSWGEAMAVDGRTYMQELPKDVRGGFTMYYRTNSARSKYQVFANLENGNDPAIPDSGTYGISCGSSDCNYGVASSNAAIDESL